MLEGGRLKPPLGSWTAVVRSVGSLHHSATPPKMSTELAHLIVAGNQTGHGQFGAQLR
jgi:hypothetical protein